MEYQEGIYCKRGVRQGDPLSPLLFVLAAELLQIIFNHAWENNISSLPIDHSYGQDYPILQYADDTLLILPACPIQLSNLKELLTDFTVSTGLRINYHKSSMVPINISTERCQELVEVFGCKVEHMPFTYLGLPMGTTRPSVDDLTPMVTKVDKRLAFISNLLSHCSRLLLLNLSCLLCPTLLCVP